MKYHGNWSLFELYNLPIGLRNFYVELLSEQIETERRAMEAAQKKKNK